MGITRIVLTISLVLQTGLSIQGRSESMVQRPKRDLATYDKAGPYKIDYEPPYSGDKHMAEIRGFLWEHWKDRRLGFIDATFYSIEGDSTLSKTFIEPDSNGRWRVLVQSESAGSILSPGRRTQGHKITYEYFQEVERFEVPIGSAALSIPISPNVVRDAQTYRLRLRNTQTKTLRVF